MKAMTKMLHVKGLHTPLPLIFLHGFINGRMKTAFVDSENNLISAYTVQKKFLFTEAAENRIVLLEKDLMAVRTEAYAAIKEVSQLEMFSDEKTALIDEETYQVSESVQQAYQKREEERCRKLSKQKQDAMRLRREEILTRLIEIRDKINSKELIASKEIEATANAIEARFSTYCHGVLLKPVYVQYIDVLDCSQCFEEYHKAHKALDCEITNFLKEASLNV